MNSMLSVWKPGRQAALFGLVGVVLLCTVVEAADFPVQVKFEDYDDSSKNVPVEDYWQDVARETGGAGIVPGCVTAGAFDAFRTEQKEKRQLYLDVVGCTKLTFGRFSQLDRRRQVLSTSLNTTPSP